MSIKIKSLNTEDGQNGISRDTSGTVAQGIAVKLNTNGTVGELSADTDLIYGISKITDGTNTVISRVNTEDQYLVEVASVTDADVYPLGKKRPALYFTGTAFTTVATDNTLVGNIVAKEGAFYVVEFTKTFVY